MHIKRMHIVHIQAKLANFTQSATMNNHMNDMIAPLNSNLKRLKVLQKSKSESTDATRRSSRTTITELSGP